MQVVVLTGASSGLGRAIAHQLARREAALVLAARRVDALQDVASECRAGGAASALVVGTDVTDELQVAKLAATALEAFGRIDVWINNAGIALYALIEDGPAADHERVIATNLYGAIYGARAALPIFRRQGCGTLINVGSVLSGVGQAFVPSYVISKFGVRGLSEALRVELADQPDIHVCTIFPYAIDTPHFAVARNRLGKLPLAMPPVQSPEKVARAVVRLVEHPRRTRYVPRIAALGLALHALFPRTVERLLLDSLRRWHFEDATRPTTGGNLYASSGAAKIHGERPPKVGLPRFLAWLAGRFVTLELRRT
jgi:short-subunit dehydrogenase